MAERVSDSTLASTVRSVLDRHEYLSAAVNKSVSEGSCIVDVDGDQGRRSYGGCALLARRSMICLTLATMMRFRIASIAVSSTGSFGAAVRTLVANSTRESWHLNDVISSDEAQRGASDPEGERSPCRALDSVMPIAGDDGAGWVWSARRTFARHDALTRQFPVRRAETARRRPSDAATRNPGFRTDPRQTPMSTPTSSFSKSPPRKRCSSISSRWRRRPPSCRTRP